MTKLFLLMLLMLSASCSHQTQPVTLTMTKIKVVTVPASMLPRPKQIESSDLKFGSCVDELVPALRSEIKKVERLTFAECRSTFGWNAWRRSYHGQF